MTLAQARQIDGFDIDLFDWFGVNRHPSTELPSDFECAQLFNVTFRDKHNNGHVVDKDLWSNRRRKLSRGEAHAIQADDHIKDGVTTQEPGSGRVDDLVAFYAANAEHEVSPFDIPEDE
jgi:hypothetical protein